MSLFEFSGESADGVEAAEVRLYHVDAAIVGLVSVDFFSDGVDGLFSTCRVSACYGYLPALAGQLLGGVPAYSLGSTCDEAGLAVYWALSFHAPHDASLDGSFPRLAE